MSPTEVRLRLLHAGYHPLPLFGKAPDMLKNWQERFNTNDQDVEMWGKQWPDAVNTGVLTRDTPALDIDILHPEAAQAVEDLVRSRFESGYCPVRTGKAPKRAILFHTDQPFDKITSVLIAPDGREERLELLASGQQLVVFGIHPETKKPYTWHGGEPGEIRAEDLTYIVEAEAKQLVADATRLLITEFGYQGKNKPKAKLDGAGATQDGNNWGHYLNNLIDHDILCQHAEALVAAGMQSGAAVNYLRAQVGCLQIDDVERVRRRLSEIPDLVRSAAEKIAAETATAPPVQSWRSYVSRPAIEIPPRPWLHAGHFIRRLVTMTVAPGGWGKTALEILNATEMVLGRGLVGPDPVGGPINVLYWNAEDPPDEVDRRIAALCQHYDLDDRELEGKLFLGSRLIGGRFAKLNLRTGIVEFNMRLVEETKRFILANRISCVILDPLVAFQSIPESQNGPMEEFVKGCLELVAEETNSNFELSQHTRKPSPGMKGELSADDSRGASSVVFAVRSARVINRMTPEEATLPNISPEERRLYVRVNRDKANMRPPSKASWIRLLGVQLPNGDNVQVATAWSYPNAFEDVTTEDMRWARDEARKGTYRTSPRSPEWFGHALAQRLNLDIEDKGDRKRVGEILKTWMEKGVLTTENRKDEHRNDREYVVPGTWNEEHGNADMAAE